MGRVCDERSGEGWQCCAAQGLKVMSRTTPHTYYDAFVFSNFEDYRERPEDIRRG